MKFHRTTIGNLATAIAHSRDVQGGQTRVNVLVIFGVMIAW